MIENIQKIKSKLNSKFLFNYNMAKSTWFQAGGNAKVFCTVYDENELQTILSINKDLPVYIIGAGSNLLVRDSGFNGLIIKLGKSFNKIQINDNKILVGSSILDINFSNFAKRNLIKDFEFYSGIPGTIGGAIKMNAGCFGSETSDRLNKIFYLDLYGNKKEATASELGLGYRKSNIDDSIIITKSEFTFEYGEKEEIHEKLNYIKNIRLKTQPIREKTSGSTFKNPPNHFAAELIENAGCKGLNIGDASVSDKHANFLINNGKASATQIEDLGKKIIDRVFNKFNILLEWEVKIIGI